MEFGAFIAPLGSERFMADHFGQRPVHIPAPEGGRSPVVDWARLKALLAIRSHWSERNIDLVMNSRAVAREHYMDGAASLEGGSARLADPNKVGAFLSMGASLVANSVEQIAPEVRALTDMLARHFAWRAEANLYCSFGGIQAFASHYDPHEVFALHCEGEKVWRIYRNRADAPLTPILGDEAAQQVIDRIKGPVLMEVRMRPGDLLYIPRGYFHDALASSGASLHLTLGVILHSGRILFRLLEETALRDRAFRDYLPDGREGEGAPLRTRLAELGDRIAEIMRSPAFLADVINSQAKLVRHDRALYLPDRPALEAFARTERPAEIVRGDDGASLRIGGGGDLALGALAEEAEWILGQPAIVVQQLLARYPHRTDEALRALVETLARAGLVVAYQPEL
jgi:lysine-specific demethylase/histidyl-hydroxylase NO66